jgi:hypothetical protein
MLMQQVQAQLLRPPVMDRRSDTCSSAEWALRFSLFDTHGALLYIN